MTYDFTPAGFPLNFSDLVARGSMSLPPMTKPDDGQFLTGMAAKVMNAFWTEYMGALPYEVQSELLIAIEQKDQDAVLDWYVRFANFPEDANARELATVILDELSEAMPEIMKQEYQDFHAASPVSV